MSFWISIFLLIIASPSLKANPIVEPEATALYTLLQQTGCIGNDACALNSYTTSVSCSKGCDEEGHILKLALSMDRLNGTIGSEIGLLTGLTSLEISFNPLLTGTLPQAFEKLTALTFLALNNNGFEGEFIDIGQFQSLKTLNIQQNQFNGTIPPLPDVITDLDIAGNRFSGEFEPPKSVETCNLYERNTLDSNCLTCESRVCYCVSPMRCDGTKVTLVGNPTPISPMANVPGASSDSDTFIFIIIASVIGGIFLIVACVNLVICLVSRSRRGRSSASTLPVHDDVSEYNDAPSLRSVGSAPIIEENYGLVPRSGNSISSSEYGQFGSPGQFNTHIDASSRAPENNSQFPPVAADGEYGVLQTGPPGAQQGGFASQYDQAHFDRPAPAGW